MDTVERFSTKATRYAHHRWAFDPAAVAHLVRVAALPPRAAAVDMGAGTGALSTVLLDADLEVIAVEPNAAMRAIATQRLGGHPGYRSLAATADATGLARGTVDLIAVGRALHWFPAQAARGEFLRIIKPGGWLAVLGTPTLDEDLLAATRAIQTAANGWDVLEAKRSRPPVSLDFYFGGEHHQTVDFPRTETEDWHQFFGRLLSYSSAPGLDDPLVGRYRAAARELFSRFAVNEQLTVRIATRLTLGRILP